MEFKLVKKGYDPQSVDEYIRRITQDYEDRLSLQKDRIFALKDEAEKNKPDTELYASLVSAINRVKHIENSTKRLFELEYKRLSLTYFKMQAIIYNAKDISSIKGDLLPLIKNCKKSLENSMKDQTSLLSDQSDDETDDETPEEDTIDAGENVVDTTDYMASSFDLREAVNPTEDLEEIMKAFDFYNDNKNEDKK